MNSMRSRIAIAMVSILFSAFSSGLCYPANVPNYPLEIIQPRPGLTTVNRYYKAYPGLEYNIRLAAIGGLYPFQFSLLEAPSGMTIDARGEITWPNPTASGSPHTVTARVVDLQPIATTVTWTITVTTDKFIFMDASAPNGGNGTIDSPFNEIVDWDKGSKTDKTYVDYFLYVKNGRYLIPKNHTNSANTLDLPANKPRVWLAYPGHTPVLDLANNGIGVVGSHSYFDGFEWDITGNQRGIGLSMNGGQAHFTFRKNKSHGITNSAIGDNNAALVSWSTENPGLYWALQDNVGYNLRNAGCWFLAYGGNKVLVEDNHIYDVGAHGIFPKQSNIMWFIRNNLLENIDGTGINVYISKTDVRPSSTDIDVSYNRIKKGGGSLRVNSSQTNPTGPVYVYRNSVYDEVHCYMVTTTTGPYYFYDNVIVNGIREPNHIHTLNLNEPSRLIVTDNITGLPSDGILDDNADLTPAYSQYVGVKGYQLGGTSAIEPVVRPVRRYAQTSGLRICDVFGRSATLKRGNAAMWLSVKQGQNSAKSKIIICGQARF